MNWETVRSILVAFPWQAMKNFLLVFGPAVLFLVVAVRAYAKYGGRLPGELKKDPGIVFLEGALEDDAVRKPNPGYTYAQFKDDLYNKGLTFEEIYEKCGGVFPQKPREPETLGRSPEGGDKDDEDRHKRLQVWFQERSETVKVFKKLVAPPANVYPLIQWRNRRR